MRDDHVGVEMAESAAEPLLVMGRAKGETSQRLGNVLVVFRVVEGCAVNGVTGSFVRVWLSAERADNFGDGAGCSFTRSLGVGVAGGPIALHAARGRAMSVVGSEGGDASADATLREGRAEREDEPSRELYRQHWVNSTRGDVEWRRERGSRVSLAYVLVHAQNAAYLLHAALNDVPRVLLDAHCALVGGGRAFCTAEDWTGPVAGAVAHHTSETNVHEATSLHAVGYGRVANVFAVRTRHGVLGVQG